MKKWIMLTVKILMVVMVGAGCMSSESKVIKHLENKYDEKFKVEDVDKASALFPSLSGKDKIFAYPEGKPEQLFVAGESQNKEGEIYDTYILAKWGEELEETMEQEVKKQIPDVSDFKIYLRIADSKYDESMMDTSIYDYLKNINKEVDVVLVAAIKTSGQPDIKPYNEGLYNLYQKLKSLNTDFYTLSVGFVEDSLNSDEYIRTSNGNNTPWSNLKGVYGAVVVNDSFQISKPEGMNEYYEVYEE
ncbi:hypothetical protein [Bacillus sp. ISL-55]|uniref:hypothetical protein n=1 Tax=Bacillus sp. ISL-55 TaxID=2819134 RepID=UPI001BE98D47|nr:hypothetical protein [Bacillus sp. ISL-55]